MSETLCSVCGTTAKQPGRDGLVLPRFQIGEPVVVRISGVTGVVVRRGHKNVGWLVRWDAPKFGVTRGWIRGQDLDHGGPDVLASVGATV